VRTAPFPLADDIVSFCDQIRRAPEVEIGECSAEIGHECLDVVTGELIDDTEIAGLAPELGKPPTERRL
jgi:hypothetical protein